MSPREITCQILSSALLALVVGAVDLLRSRPEHLLRLPPDLRP